MPSIRVKDNEPVEVAMRRFKRSCEKAGILTEMRRREYFEKPTEARKRRAAAAIKRHFKRLLRENPLMMRANGSAKRGSTNTRGEKGGRGEKSGRGDRNA